MNETDPFTTPRAVPTTTPAEQPSHIGRYLVEKILGEGSFGRVYLAHDEQLGRPVAIKVPHAHRVRKPEDVASYLAETRVLASLEHPGIVPVYDFGSTDDGLCFVVSKLVEGSDLAARIAAGRPAFAESALLVATVADALHYAHQRGLVHRDIRNSSGSASRRWRNAPPSVTRLAWTWPKTSGTRPAPCRRPRPLLCPPPSRRL